MDSDKHTNIVSILTQPEGWVPSTPQIPTTLTKMVSILTQPEGWVPLSCIQVVYTGQGGFNPHPTRRLGAIFSVVVVGSGSPFKAFQSSPNPKVGCHEPLVQHRESGTGVSILTQPEGWVPSKRNANKHLAQLLFQSSPNPKVGCHRGRKDHGSPRRFVSILTQPEGWVPWIVHRRTFLLFKVSILTQPEGWVPCL